MTESLRIDKWLWHARMFRTRVLAQEAAASGLVRVNSRRIEKSSVEVRGGDLVTVAGRDVVLILKVLEFGIRRGTFAEARLLYEIHNGDTLDPVRPQP